MAKKAAPAFMPPSKDGLAAILGKKATAAWVELTSYVESRYPGFSQLWGGVNKAGLIELKYRRSGKTLCSFYVREKRFGFMVIFGKAEQAAFEAERDGFSPETVGVFDAARAYHDGKWLMFEIHDKKPLPEMRRLLAMKKKPVAE